MNTGIPHVFGLTAQWSSTKDFHVWIHFLKISSCVWGSQTWRTCFDFVVCFVVAGQLQGIVTEVNAVLHEPSLISLVKEAHLWLFTFGELK
jgi:hypothetical protein